MEFITAADCVMLKSLFLYVKKTARILQMMIFLSGKERGTNKTYKISS
jgi:hypothetical protein